MKNNTTKKLCLSAIFLATILTGQTGVAAEYMAAVRAGVGVSDNIARIPQLEIDETILTAGFDFSATEQTNRLDLDLQSSFDYLDYVDESFDAEWIGGFNGSAVFTLVDEKLQWVAQDTFGQQLFDPFQPGGPGNRENINFFTTGPTLSLLPGERNVVIIDARYSRVNFEETPSDNERLFGGIIIGRDTSRETRVSLNMTAERIEFDETDLVPMDRYSAFIRYEKTGLRDTLGINLGYNAIESGGDDADGVLFEVDWSRTTSANGQLTMSGGSRYSDQGNIFRLMQGISLDLTNTIDLPDTDEPFLNNFYIVTYELDQARYSIDLVASWNQEDFKGQSGRDRDMYQGNMRFRREVSRTVFAGADIGFLRRDFKYLPRRDDDLFLGLNVGYRIGSGFDISIEYQHFQRNSVDVGADFTENRAFLRATYTPVWSRPRD